MCLYVWNDIFNSNERKYIPFWAVAEVLPMLSTFWSFSFSFSLIIWNRLIQSRGCKIVSLGRWHKTGLTRKKKAARGHYLPPFIQGNWLTIDDQKNYILASLCLARYLVANWLQKLKMKHCLLRRIYFCLYVCVWYLSLIYL